MLQFFLTSSPIFAVVALGFAAARVRLVAPGGFAAFATYAFEVGIQSGDIPLGASVSLFMLPILAVASFL